MKLINVKPTPKGDKNKFVALFETDDGKIKRIGFGVKGSFSYVDGADVKVRDNYRARHSRDITSNDPTTRGNLSYWITWGDSPSLSQNIADYRRKFGV